MSKITTFLQDTFSHCCGVSEVGSFEWKEHDEVDGWADEKTGVSPQGTRMFVSTFIDNEHCKRAYEELTSKHKLLYQSPPRMNAGSGNQVFLCVFLHKDAA